MKKTSTLIFVVLLVLPQISLSSLNVASLSANENLENKGIIKNGKRHHSEQLDDAFEELVIGVENTPPKNYRDLIDLISKYGGNVLNNISFKKKVEAIVASLPLPLTPLFVKEAENSVTPDYIEPNVRFKIDMVPNDPNWNLQWGPRKIEADYVGTQLWAIPPF